eukprot:TRINITY_DN3559_c0_g1_i2.p1 TRINITY_DN3559_c0_g1~~TRINITY_DN3559_c0_g1_i2.p1  ORF type:complete len:165 (+),score=15.53 TRINITY_DN3559_c0_g1_i2:60-554(+)
MTPSLCEAWFTLIGRMGEIMLASYDSVKQGKKATLYKRSRNSWKKYWCILTHEKLSLFRDSEYRKHKVEIFLNFVDDIDIINDESISKLNDFCFMLGLGLKVLPVYFCCETKKDFEWWMFELTERIRAYQRINVSDDSTEEPSQKFVKIGNKLKKKRESKLHVN